MPPCSLLTGAVSHWLPHLTCVWVPPFTYHNEHQWALGGLGPASQWTSMTALAVEHHFDSGPPVMPYMVGVNQNLLVSGLNNASKSTEWDESCSVGLLLSPHSPNTPSALSSSMMALNDQSQSRACMSPHVAIEWSSQPVICLMHSTSHGVRHVGTDCLSKVCASTPCLPPPTLTAQCSSSLNPKGKITLYEAHNILHSVSPQLTHEGFLLMAVLWW
ncbi:hypothetical protein BS17DRAFT_764539 [Gyrodon lividus]|nr:hypothetical protein BS17DRAFT_764539 [Gyrodon lividus]